VLQLADFAAQSAAMLDLVRSLAAIESPTTDKAAVDRLGADLAARLTELGADVTIEQQQTAGDHVIARWPGSDPTRRPLVLLSHMDTVWDIGTLAQRPLREVDGRLYGPGVLDMKGGIAVALTALRTLKEQGAWPARPIVALFTSDEETGSVTSRLLIETEAHRAALALVLEPGLNDGALKTARKGTGYLRLIATGRASHAGADHAGGRNAIAELAHHVLDAQALTDYTAGTTVNVGVIQGGTRTNVVPDHAEAAADIRVATPAEARRLAQWAATRRPVIDGASITATLTLNRSPMARDATMIETFRRAQTIASRLGRELREGSTGGGSDGNFAAALGAPVLDGLGPWGDGGHAEHEHLLIESLAERAALLAALISEWP
jgi:glutamate carboxypeptidase